MNTQEMIFEALRSFFADAGREVQLLPERFSGVLFENTLTPQRALPPEAAEVAITPLRALFLCANAAALAHSSLQGEGYADFAAKYPPFQACGLSVAPVRNLFALMVKGFFPSSCTSLLDCHKTVGYLEVCREGEVVALLTVFTSGESNVSFRDGNVDQLALQALSGCFGQGQFGHLCWSQAVVLPVEQVQAGVDLFALSERFSTVLEDYYQRQ